MRQKIWLSPPHMSGHELNYIQEAFEQNWISPVGPHIEGFEHDLCRYNNITNAVALSSGTAALHLALLALGVGKDDIVLCQSLTFAGSANPIRYVSATPVFIDSEANSWNICSNALETAIKFFIRRGKKPAAVICVHLYGMPANLDDLHFLAQRYAIPIIEDAAEALGSRYRDRCLGTFGEVGILSFNGNKIITTSSGGALLSANKKLTERVRFLSSQAKDPAPHYQHSEIGYNYMMSNICAGIGRGQMMVLADRVKRRRENFGVYQQAFAKVSGVTFQCEDVNSFSNRWLTVVNIDPKTAGMSAQSARLHLAEHNIETRPVWKPVHLQPVFRDAPYFGGNIAEELFTNGLCLPSGSNLCRELLDFIIGEFLREANKQKRLP